MPSVISPPDGSTLGTLIGGQEPLEDTGGAFDSLASGACRDAKNIINTGATAP